MAGHEKGKNFPEFPNALQGGCEVRTRCVKCGEQFTTLNVRTAGGWAETKKSGMCEDCFTAYFRNLDEDSKEGN